MFMLKLAMYGILGAVLNIAGVSIYERPGLLLIILVLVLSIDVLSKFEK